MPRASDFPPGQLTVRSSAGSVGGGRAGEVPHNLPPPHPAPAVCSAPTRKGAKIAISSERPARRAGPDYAIPRHQPIHRTVGEIIWGRGRGGNPLPVDKSHTGPSPGFPRRRGACRGDSPGGAWPVRQTRIPLSSLPPPHPAPAVRSAPTRKGATIAISSERPARRASPDYALPRHQPTHRIAVDITTGDRSPVRPNDNTHPG